MNDKQDVAALVEEARSIVDQATREGDEHSFPCGADDDRECDCWLGLVRRLAATLASQARDLAAAQADLAHARKALRRSEGSPEWAAAWTWLDSHPDAAIKSVADTNGRLETERDAAREDAARLRLDLGLAEIAARQERDLRAAAEVALAERDAEIERLRKVVDDRERHRRAAWAFVEEMEAAAREALDIPRNPDPDIHMEPGEIRAERLRARLAEERATRDQMQAEIEKLRAERIKLFADCKRIVGKEEDAADAARRERDAANARAQQAEGALAKAIEVGARAGVDEAVKVLNQTPIATAWTDCPSCDESQQEQDAEATVREATREMRRIDAAALAALAVSRG